MKKVVLSFVALATFGMMAVSCTSEEVNVSEKVITSEINHKLVLSEDFAKSNTENVDYYSQSSLKLVVPEKVGEKSSEVLTKALLNVAFPKDSVSQSWEEAVKVFNETVVDFGNSQLGEVVDSIPEGARILSKSVCIDSLTRNHNLLTFHVVQEGYLGGAHGYYSSAYVNYDAETDKVVVPADLFANIESTRNLILNSMMKKNGLKSVKELETNGVVFDLKDVNVSNNFYPAADSVVFFYNPYEISSWAQGAVEVKVAKADMDTVLTEYGKKLLLKK